MIAQPRPSATRVLALQQLFHQVALLLELGHGGIDLRAREIADRHPLRDLVPPSAVRTGKEQIRSGSISYSPREQSPTLYQSPSGVGVVSERTVSTTAFAAEAAEERAARLDDRRAALLHRADEVASQPLGSRITPVAGAPADARVFGKSGYMVAE